MPHSEDPRPALAPGDVSRPHEEALDRLVVIKVLPPALARHEDFVRRFRSEAAAAPDFGLCRLGGSH